MIKENKTMTQEEFKQENKLSLLQVYEAATKGFWILEVYGVDKTHTPISRPVFVDISKSAHKTRVDFKNKEIVSREVTVKFDDYGRTWSLAKEELE